MVFELVVTDAPDGVVVLTVSGEVGMSTAPDLRRALVRSATEAVAPPRLVLDLSGVDLLDTTGLAAILEGVKRCRLRGGDLVLARAEPQVVRELELTGLGPAFPVHPTVADAVAAVSRAAGPTP